MTDHATIAAQLRRELGGVAASVAALFGVDLAEQLDLRLHDTCRRLASDLTGDDDRIAARTTTEVMTALWPDGVEPPPTWWATPLGRTIARSVGNDGDAVTQSVAAAMLGVDRSTVATMLLRGRRGQGGSGGLDPHPDGGVTRASVLARIARQT